MLKVLLGVVNLTFFVKKKFIFRKESCQLKVSIRRKLQEILVNVDLDTVTSREVRFVVAVAMTLL